MRTGGVSGRKRFGWPRVVCTPQVINAVRSRINQNSVQKQKQNQKNMDWEMNIATRIMSPSIKQDLGLGTFKRQTMDETFNKQ